MSKIKDESVTIKQPAGSAPAPVRVYKDRIFRMIFKEKKEFLELYNALNGTGYANSDELVVTTLENAIYMNMKNDVSFLLHDQLTLYEHQSTNNPNMPLRNLFYVADVYSGLVQLENLYRSRPVQIPEPRFVEFYNGTKELPERSERKLSDLYFHPVDNPALELKILVLNINPGYNMELMGKCRTLWEYMIFVSKVREYSRGMPLSQAMEKAVAGAIKENILADFLRKNRAEVIKVGIYEYNEELHIQQEREDAREEGMKEGIKEGMEKGSWLNLWNLIRKKMEKGLSAEETADILEIDVSTVQKYYILIKEEPGLSDDEFYRKYLKMKNSTI